MRSVIIIGAGPAGAALAYLLARRGVSVTLLEQHHDFSRVFRGEGFQPSGINAIRQMGLGTQLDALPSTAVNELYIWHRDRQLAQFRLAETQGADDPRIISQPALLEMLTAEAARFPNFRLVRGAAVRDLISENGRYVGVDADIDGIRQQLRADLIIGADGRDSVARHRSGLHMEKLPQSFDFVWGYIPRPEWWPQGRAELFLDDQGGIIVLPSYSGQLQLGLNIGKGEYKELRAAGQAAWFDLITSHARRELAEHIRGVQGQIKPPTLLNVVCDYLTNWTAPGLLLIGDAAHPMSPVGGQGVNVALRDTLVAANHLVPVLTPDSSPAEIDAACARIQAERGEEVLAIQKLQTAHAKTLLLRGWKARAMRTALPLLMKIPAVRRRSFTGERGFGKLQKPIRLTV
jgi:2-polyprenyl-6-methoxyphenol hydroxylase-like FAD-dependent oxidoreductase